jgi:hypothetical protein
MGIIRYSLPLVTDTGANAAEFTPSIMGRLLQVAGHMADTGVRADTGAVITLTADTGNLNLRLGVFHNLPNDRGWAKSLQQTIYDTGGGAVSAYEPIALAGEKIKASVQGIAADTGKELNLFLYVEEAN